jgi:hypothetical protein
MLEVLFCEAVQHRLQFCLDHLNCVKMTAFQFYLQSGVGDDNCIISDKKNSVVRRCCLDATASSFVAKVRGEVFAHVYIVPIKRHNNLRN